MTPAAGDGAAATTMSPTTMSPPTMSEAERYQRLRSHLAFLRLPTATEALPEVLDRARAAPALTARRYCCALRGVAFEVMRRRK